MYNQPVYTYTSSHASKISHTFPLSHSLQHLAPTQTVFTPLCNTSHTSEPPRPLLRFLKNFTSITDRLHSSLHYVTHVRTSRTFPAPPTSPYTMTNSLTHLCNTSHMTEHPGLCLHLLLNLTPHALLHTLSQNLTDPF